MLSVVVSIDFRERPGFNLADGIVCSILIHVGNLEATGLPGILVKIPSKPAKVLNSTFLLFSVFL